MSTQQNLSPNLFKAMAQAFFEIEGALKDSENPAYRSKYADFSSVAAAVKPALAKHGLFFLQNVHPGDGVACVETIIGHESGEQISCGMVSVPITKKDAHGYGSALTYARRYGLASALGVCPEDVGAQKDDDGNAACGKEPKEAKEPVSPSAKMSPEEIAAYAREIAAKTRAAGFEVNVENLTAYFAYFQKIRPNLPLKETIDKEVAARPGVFAENLEGWAKKNAA